MEGMTASLRKGKPMKKNVILIENISHNMYKLLQATCHCYDVVAVLWILSDFTKLTLLARLMKLKET